MNKTIMIVDDLRSNIYMLADILDSKYKIIPATSGTDAITLLGLKKIDLLLLDVFMPGIDGFGVLKYVKEHSQYKNIPVILVTGDEDRNTEEMGLTLGADDCIKKPFNATVIRMKVIKHIELKSYRDNIDHIAYERTKTMDIRLKQFETRTLQLTAAHEAIIMGMSLMSESHDELAVQHIQRIKKVTELLTDSLLETSNNILSPELADQIILHSTLHDVGKVGVSDFIVTKTGLFTPQEFDSMKSHTIDGVELLKKIQLCYTDAGLYTDNGLRVAIEIVGSHHERFDGTGYPFGLKGEEIPLSARIVAIADVYDALRSARPYKNAVSHLEAVNIINTDSPRTSASHFDPQVLDAFNSVKDKIDLLYW